MMISIRRAVAASAASAVSLAMLASLSAPAAATVRPLAIRSQANTNAFSVLHTFMGMTDGLAPRGDLDVAIKNNGNNNYSEILWGATLGGGNMSSGTVFNMLVGSKTLNTTYQFTGGADGSLPDRGLANNESNYFASGNNQYGTTDNGGTMGEGNIYVVNGAGAVKSLYSFSGGNDGAFPSGRLTQFTDGNYYGTTSAGGKFGYGTIFKVSTSGAFSAIYSFTGQADGASPGAGLSLLVNLNGKANVGHRGGMADVVTRARAMNSQYVSNYLYGTTTAGGANNNGTIFRITSSGAFTTLHSFTTAEGASPQAKLSTDLNGNLYGTTSVGASGNAGTAFVLAQGSTTPKILWTFGGATGSQPLGQILVAFDGNLYGTTSTDGAFGYGTIYKITSKGVFSDIHDFNFTDGASSNGGLVDGGNGTLYGATSDGGIGDGVLFSIAG